MKKYVGTLIAGITLVAGLPLSAMAADTADTQSTKAQVELSQDTTDPGKNAVTLDQAPGVDFGSQTIDNSTTTYDADSVSDSIKVTNPGNTEGWSVSVSGTDFTDKTKTLKGAVLSFKDAEVSADDTANVSNHPTSSQVDVNADNQTILGANADEGIGKFTAGYTKENVQLLVPAGNSAGSYSSTLTWTLGNAPS